MSVAVTVATLVAACAASLFMAWAIGAGSSGSTPFAPAVGAKAIPVMQAAFFVGLFGFAGAVLQGANVSQAVGTELIRGVTLSPLAAVMALVTAAVLVAVGVFAGYPIATAFTVTGSVIGAGLALGGAPAWGKYQQVATLWLLVPVVGGTIAYAVARTLEGRRLSNTVVVPALAALVGLVVANVDLAVLSTDAGGASIAEWSSVYLPLSNGLGVPITSAALSVGAASVSVRGMRDDPVLYQRRFLLFLGSLVAFSAGGSQVGLAVGPLLPLFEPYSIPLWAMLVGGGLGLLLGSWMGAPRMIKALSQDYSSLSPQRATAVLVPSFLIAQSAVFFGVPVSFNEIIVSAIVGSGLAGRGAAEVSGGKIGYTVLAWVGSLAVTLIAGYAATTLASELVLAL